MVDTWAIADNDSWTVEGFSFSDTVDNLHLVETE